MQWLLQLRLVEPDWLRQGMPDEISQLVGEHFAYWQSLTRQGIAFVVGRTQDEDPIGLAIFHADSAEAADAVVRADPAVGPVFIYTVRPYAIALRPDADTMAAQWGHGIPE